jgi:CRP/FNR family cyclic AMP-dependent transcriptional regulator
MMPISPPEQWPASTLLSRLSERTAAALLGLGMERRVAPGRVLMREGTCESYVIVLRSGLAKVTAETTDGRTALLSLRVHGDLIGEMAALSGHPRSATVTMCGNGLVHIVQGRDFGTFLTAHPDAAIEMATMVGERLRWSNQRRMDFASYPVRTRLARIIAELADLHGRTAGNGARELGVRLTQRELATLCGAAEITVHKALRDLHRCGVLSTRYGRLSIWDVSSLRREADLSPGSHPAGRQ